MIRSNRSQANRGPKYPKLRKGGYPFRLKKINDFPTKNFSVRQYPGIDTVRGDEHASIVEVWERDNCPGVIS